MPGKWAESGGGGGVLRGRICDFIKEADLLPFAWRVSFCGLLRAHDQASVSDPMLVQYSHAIEHLVEKRFVLRIGCFARHGAPLQREADTEFKQQL